MIISNNKQFKIMIIARIRMITSNNDNNRTYRTEGLWLPQVTPRLLEALIRLSEARAKAELRRWAPGLSLWLSSKEVGIRMLVQGSRMTYPGAKRMYDYCITALIKCVPYSKDSKLPACLTAVAFVLFACSADIQRGSTCICHRPVETTFPIERCAVCC